MYDAEAIKPVQIYALLDPATGETRYIGKANNAKARLSSHMRDCRRRHTPLYSWMRKLMETGKLPGLSIIAECEPSAWREVEQKHIALARAAGTRLLNLADGGDEPYCAPEVRASNGRKVASLRVSDEKRSRVYHLKRQIGLLLKAGHVSDASKAKLKLAAAKAPHLFGQWAAL